MPEGSVQLILISVKEVSGGPGLDPGFGNTEVTGDFDRVSFIADE